MTLAAAPAVVIRLAVRSIFMISPHSTTFFYVSGGGDIEFNQHNDGNQNGSLYYSIPFGYWALGLYGSQSQYRQLFRGNWSQNGL